MRAKKTLEYLESVSALLAFIGLVTISAFTVSSINPKVAGDSQVAGLQDQKVETATTPVKIETLLNKENSELQYDIAQNSKEVIYTFNFSSLTALVESNFINLTNIDNGNANLKAKVELPQSLKQDLEIIITDEVDTIQLNSTVTGNSYKLITIAGNSSKVYKIQFIPHSNINYPITLQVKLY